MLHYRSLHENNVSRKDKVLHTLNLALNYLHDLAANSLVNEPMTIFSTKTKSMEIWGNHVQRVKIVINDNIIEQVTDFK